MNVTQIDSTIKKLPTFVQEPFRQELSEVNFDEPNERKRERAIMPLFQYALFTKNGTFSKMGKITGAIKRKARIIEEVFRLHGVDNAGDLRGEWQEMTRCGEEEEEKAANTFREMQAECSAATGFEKFKREQEIKHIKEIYSRIGMKLPGT